MMEEPQLDKQAWAGIRVCEHLKANGFPDAQIEEIYGEMVVFSTADHGSMQNKLDLLNALGYKIEGCAINGSRFEFGITENDETKCR